MLAEQAKSFTVRRNQPNSTLPLAADADIDALSAFTARILAVHLRLETGFIDIYERFFRNIFDFFLNMLLLVWGFVLCKTYFFFV